jgi:hypothetical protein
MTTIGRPFSVFHWPFSGAVNQAITTPWFSPSYTVNYVGDPTIEQRVVSEVASYGRQLGWLDEIVLALAAGKELPPETQETVKQLRRASDEIKKIKEEVQRSALEEANDALDRLEREQPRQYERLLARRRNKV